MLEAYCLGSSSSGNSYIFDFSKGDGHSVILVEAGFTKREIISRATQQATKLSQCEACLITHQHSDHAKGAKEISDNMPVFASQPTLDACGITFNGNTLRDWTTSYVTPAIKVLPFIVEHDCPEPMGFAINAFGGEDNVLFVNDCRSVPRDLSMIPFDYVFAECNYEDQAMHIEYSNAKRDGDRVLISRYSRIFHSHMGLTGLVGPKSHEWKGFLETLDLSRCKAIFLMHLSDRNARETVMRQTVMARFPGIRVFVCQKQGGIL